MDFKNLSVLIPLTASAKTQSDRMRNLEWIKNRYKALMPEAEICIGESNIEPFSINNGYNNAIKKSTREILFFTDADIFFDPQDMKRAIDMLEEYRCIVPFQKYIKLSKEVSDSILSGAYNINTNDIELKNSLLRFDSLNMNDSYNFTGYLTLIKKEDFKLCGGGVDERFKGWGRCDDAFRLTFEHVFGGFKRPINMSVYHLNHSLSERNNPYLEYNTKLLINDYNKNTIENTIENLSKIFNTK